MTQPAKAQEPSMEEILASIRRIIADDDATKTAQRTNDAAKAAPKPAAPRPSPPEPKPPEPAAEDPVDSAAADGGVQDQAADILDLTESMAAPAFVQPAAPPTPPPGPPPQFRKIEPYSDVSFADAEQKPPGDGPAPPLARDGGERGEQLLSRSTSAAVDSAFNSLAQTVLVHNARTLEDLVREMLRPMLKSWLDDNLPSLVERLVRAEIERVARGR
jgi:uncharacterized protein